jgi:hypothetical protein
MNTEAKGLTEQIDTYSTWLKNARTLYANNKNAYVSKIEFVSNQLKHQAIGKIEVLPNIIKNLKAYEKEIQRKSVGKNISDTGSGLHIACVTQRSEPFIKFMAWFRKQNLGKYDHENINEQLADNYIKFLSGG